MTPFLDDERLEGPHVARISARPRRTAIPLGNSGINAFCDAIAKECQLWGGASNVFVPLDTEGMVPSLYRTILPGSQIDDVHGIHGDLEMKLEVAPDLHEHRDLSGSQLAAGLLPYRPPQKTVPLEVVELSAEDMWRGIYAACLGLLPEKIDEELISSGHWLPDIDFDDFLDVQRVKTEGSLNDLLSRVWPAERKHSPRQLSMVKLSHASTASTSIRSKKPVLPRNGFFAHDAGPNILVVCSPDSLDDLAYLWNLRAAHGDFYAAPLGIPISELTTEALQRVLGSTGIARHGIAASSLYITSVSANLDQLEALVGVNPSVRICPPEELVAFGTVHGLARDEVLTWSEGRASYRQIDVGKHHEILDQRNVNEMTVMQFDISVTDAPLPLSDDYRVDSFYGTFHNGSRSVWSSLREPEKISSVEWPSRKLAADSLASIRDLELRSSAPGIAAKILIQMLGGIYNVDLLCHRPILDLLETMAARKGFNWYKKRLRDAGQEANPLDSVGSSIDELPEMNFNDFKKALRNNDAATKYWLAWAERSKVILKGFSLLCPDCGAKQWTPVSSFAPPIVCRGCTNDIEYPFGDRPTANFTYRLSEQSRRVYEVDAMGHILAARYFESVFSTGSGSQLIGFHPGMSVFESEGDQEIGEADVLLLTRWGDLIPIEVKRTASGLTEGELAKLGRLSTALRSSWSGVVACQYSASTDGLLESLGSRNDDGTHRIMALSYDQLLSPHIVWRLGGDPFAFSQLSEDEIKAREEDFVRSLVNRSKETNSDWLAYSMVRRRERQ